MSLIAEYSIEKLVHFRCAAPDCGKWWAMGDAPVNRHYYCPWCGELHFGCKEAPPPPPPAEGEYYDDDYTPGRFPPPV